MPFNSNLKYKSPFPRPPLSRRTRFAGARNYGDGAVLQEWNMKREENIVVAPEIFIV